MRIEEFLMSQALLGAGNRGSDPREKMAAEILNGFRTAASVDAIVRMAHYTPQDYRNAELGSMSFMSDLHHLARTVGVPSARQEGARPDVWSWHDQRSVADTWR